jgi:hypothetical protein
MIECIVGYLLERLPRLPRLHDYQITKIARLPRLREGRVAIVRYSKKREYLTEAKRENSI